MVGLGVVGGIAAVVGYRAAAMVGQFEVVAREASALNPGLDKL